MNHKYKDLLTFEKIHKKFGHIYSLNGIRVIRFAICVPEHGVAMLSTVLNGKLAVNMSILII